MKFLVLALCACAASAASITPFSRQPYQPLRAVADAFVAPVNTAYTAQVVTDAPVLAAKTIYTAVKPAYDTDKAANAGIVRSASDVSPDSFNFYYETSNGIAAQATGALKKVGNENALGIEGSYKYVVDGKEVVVTYVADENGFQPQSDILPVAPAIPEAILRSLEYIRTHPQVDAAKQY